MRLRIGCADFVDDGSPFCYVVSSCTGSLPSFTYPSAHYVGCTVSPHHHPQSRRATIPYFQDQWHIPRARVPDAWGELGGRTNLTGIELIVVDDGVDIHHPDLRVHAYFAWKTNGDRVAQPAVSYDVDTTHGTACAGWPRRWRTTSTVLLRSCGM